MPNLVSLLACKEIAKRDTIESIAEHQGVWLEKANRDELAALLALGIDDRRGGLFKLEHLFRADTAITSSVV